AAEGEGTVTLVAPKSVRAPSAPPTGPSVSGGSVTRAPSAVGDTTLLAVRGDEAARARSFARAIVVLAVVGLGLQLLYAGHPTLRIATFGAHGALVAVGGWVWHRTRDPRRYGPFVFRVFGATTAAASLVLIWYLGIFSPVAAAVVLGFAFFSIAEDRRPAVAIALFVATAHFVSAMLVVAGVVADPGVIAPTGASRVGLATMALMVYFVYLVALVQGLVSRRTMLEAIERSNAATRLARDREAQLEEARENLDVAMRVPGRVVREATCGRFVLGELVGRGAMGEIFAAHDPASGQRVAVKLLHARAADDPDLTRRFLREAEITANLRGPNIVDVLEVGATEGGVPFIAMELLTGADLAAVLRRRATLDLDEATTLADDVAKGLDLAHAAGIVHRDLKPSNLFLADAPDGRPRWKVLDFGVSRLLGSQGTLTEGQVVGTPGYMSPEQAQGRATDATADVFSLGAVLYRALTGRRPFGGGDVPRILFGVVYEQPPRPREAAPALPRDVELVLAIALAKRPSDRFASAGALALALRAGAKNRLGAADRERARALLDASPWGSSTGARAPVRA
ncbi:MAG: serine/threonine protein kinase, partial [Myxococcales bacterium]|nr:serine/threonine protein kinase [Myxococcales bacterium]